MTKPSIHPAPAPPGAAPNALPGEPVRKPRLLWANVYCLLDCSSGASMTAREMLRQLEGAGYDVRILGASVFDDERGTAGVLGQWPALQARQGEVLKLGDGPLEHRTLITADTRRDAMSCAEESRWFLLYRQALDRVRPDVVFYYGGQPLDFLIAAEARARGIPVAFYLANASYGQSRWCRDVDLVLTNSSATANLYARRLGVVPVAVGAFIDPARVLFINPSLEKGVAVVVRLAMMLEQRRPDIVFEVVESRGNWGRMLRAVSTALGDPRETLANVTVTAHTSDMRPVYGRARLRLAPSLWWESMGRVLVEAMLNGIPPVVTDRGGMPEMVGEGGIMLRFDEAFHEKPYTRVPLAEALEPLVQRLEALYDDEATYALLAAAALRAGQAHHRDASTRRLLQALAPLVAQRAGDSDTGAALRQLHRHGLDDWAPAESSPKGAVLRPTATRQDSPRDHDNLPRRPPIIRVIVHPHPNPLDRNHHAHRHACRGNPVHWRCLVHNGQPQRTDGPAAGQCARHQRPDRSSAPDVRHMPDRPHGLPAGPQGRTEQGQNARRVHRRPGLNARSSGP